MPLGAIRFSLIIQQSRHLWMVRPEDLLDHCDSALIQGFCLGILPLISVDEGEAGEAGGDVEMQRAKGLLRMLRARWCSASASVYRCCAR